MKHSFILIALLLAPLAALNAAQLPTQKPNILFLIADDLATRLGCYGDRAAITPNLDRLAREGILFTRAYAQGSVCIPSRTSFMLGLNNRHAGADHFKRNPETMTLGRWFRQHGYQTFSVGKIDHDETYTDPQAWDIRVPISACRPGTKGTNRLQAFDEDLGERRSTGLRFKTEEAAESLGDWARTQRAIQFLEQERDAHKPFFAAVGFHAPHDPWESTRAIHEAHDPARFTLDWLLPADATPLSPQAMHSVPGYEMSDARQREGQQHYYAAVATLDQQIGRLLDALRRQGLHDNTLVVFTSDQGFHLGWRGQWHKHTISEQVLRVPLIVRMPGGPVGARANGIVELLDLFPTFCDLAGLPAPAGLDGQSFLPLLKDPQTEGKAGAFCSMPRGWGAGRTVRTQRWRLVERLDGSRELYDHSTDPAEYVNIVNHPEHEALIRRLHTMLEDEFGPLPSDVPGKTQAPPPD
ncbi:MAG: sulfatase [Pirellulaceae bacterium]|nr:sulfatase [Pirellulaceae bacterium]